jgi:hypothetical protein
MSKSLSDFVEIVPCICVYRFVREKAEYKGVWTIPKRRAKKHPLAPKRPMSAFLKYSQTRRAKVKEENPDMRQVTAGEGRIRLSRLLELTSQPSSLQQHGRVPTPGRNVA